MPLKHIEGVQPTTGDDASIAQKSPRQTHGVGCDSTNFRPVCHSDFQGVTSRRRYVHLPKVTIHPWPMCSTRTRPVVTRLPTDEPSSAGLLPIRVRHSNQKESNRRGRRLDSLSSSVPLDQKESKRRRYVDLPVSGLKLISTRSLCCQLGPRNWQIHVASTPDSITSDGMWICQFRGSSCSAQGPCAVSLGPKTGRSTYTEPKEYVLLQTLEHCSKTYSLVKFQGPS